MMLPPAPRVYLACGFTDMRKGFDGLAALVQTALSLDPYRVALFIFRDAGGSCDIMHPSGYRPGSRSVFSPCKTR